MLKTRRYKSKQRRLLCLSGEGRQPCRHSQPWWLLVAGREPKRRKSSPNRIRRKTSTIKSSAALGGRWTTRIAYRPGLNYCETSRLMISSSFPRNFITNHGLESVQFSHLQGQWIWSLFSSFFHTHPHIFCSDMQFAFSFSTSSKPFVAVGMSNP